MPRVCIGIDLGGTFIKLALLDEQLRLTSQDRRPTPADSGPDAVVEAMASGAEALLDAAGAGKPDVAGVGIGSPGPLDLDAGVVIGMPNLTGFEGFPLRDRLAERLALPAALENDANAAALGEFLVGAARDVRHMVLLTLGTGVGSGIVIDGRLVHGAHGLGGEVGHLLVAPGGRPCGCGQSGCLERYASATYLAQHARKLLDQGRPTALANVLAETGEITAEHVQLAAADGDELAKEVWAEAIDALAVACVGLARVLDPDLVVFGGGMANAGDALIAPLRRRFHELHWRLTPPRTQLALATLGNDAGVIGAAGVAWQQFAPAGAD